MIGDALEHRRIESQIGDHMVTELAQFSFEEPIYAVNETESIIPATAREDAATVVRTYLPEYALEESDSPRISITPFGFTQEPGSRNHKIERFAIDLVLHQRLVGPPHERERTPTEQTADWRQKITQHGDHAMKIAEQARFFFETGGRRFAKIEECQGCTCARWISVQGSPIWQDAEAEGKQLVLSVQRHIWLTVRELCACA